MSAYEGPDPHDIVPDDFEYSSLTAARQDIEADYLHAKRCPDCASTNLTPLSSKATSGTDESYKCKTCYERFDDPRQSRFDEQMERYENTDWEERRRRREARESVPDIEETSQFKFSEVAR